MAWEFVPTARAQSTRFWANVCRFGGPETCWLWKAGVCKDGYGKFALTLPRSERPRKQSHQRAHRLAWILEHGRLPDADRVVMHACDTPRCCNPAHLALGTQADNRADCGRKGRNASGDRHGSRRHPERRMRGERHPMKKLTDLQVLEVCARFDAGEMIMSLAAAYGMDRNTIAGIVRRKARLEAWAGYPADSAEAP